MKTGGKTGRGCLLSILVCLLVAIGLSVHPISLKLMGGQLRHEDKIFPSDALFVPRFEEDRDGDLYIDAFREYWAGNGRIIYVEEDRAFGTSILEPIHRMAQQRGIKDNVVRKIEVEGDDIGKTRKTKRAFAALGLKKMIILVPEYASRRYHILYRDSVINGKMVYLIKPVGVSSFKIDRWWKEGRSRIIFLREVFAMASLAVDRFKGPR
ncbi:MAG: hypothetical protein LBQ00_00845 [Syntrophobacterales bacterium]|jgi:hypothetical protein|nr:hypothetical protein [Syntrophobacterales bacterium]